MSGQTFKSDIWSLGCTVLELLTGHPPYWDVDPMRAMFCIVQDATPAIPDNLPQEVKDFLLRCFVKDPAERASAEQLLESPWIVQNSHLVSLAGASLDYNSVVGTLSKVYGKKKSIKTSKSKKVSRKKTRGAHGTASPSDVSPAASSLDLAASDPTPEAVATPPSLPLVSHSEPATVAINSLSISHSDNFYHQPAPQPSHPEPHVGAAPDPDPLPEAAVEPTPAPEAPAEQPAVVIKDDDHPKQHKPIPEVTPVRLEPDSAADGNSSNTRIAVGLVIIGVVVAAAFVLSRHIRG